MKKGGIIIAILIIAVVAIIAASHNKTPNETTEQNLIENQEQTPEATTTDREAEEEAQDSTLTETTTEDEAPSEDPAEAEATTSQNTTTEEATTAAPAPSGPGTFADYSPDLVASAAGDVVLFFHASWCPSCRALSNDINTNTQNIPNDLTILKLDYDTETDLRKQYGVNTQHTLVQVDNQGNLIQKWSGGSQLSDLVARVQ